MKILIILLFLVKAAFAQGPGISISHFNLNYKNPSGVADAKHLILAGYSFENSPRFTVEQQAGNFVLETADEIITIENVPEQIIELENLTVSNFNLETNTSKISLDVDQFNGSDIETKIDIKSVAIDCQYEHLSEDIKDEFLNSCVNNTGRIKIARFSENGKNHINNGDFRFNKNNLSFKIKAQGLNVKGSGKAYYTPGLLRIKIEKAKVGFLNVKKKMFKELEKIESQKVRVSNPWIEVDL